VVPAVVWVVTRGLVVWLYLGRHAWVSGDLTYFAQSLSAIPDSGLVRTLVEYPLPGVLVVAVPWLLARAVDAPTAYGEVVLVLSLLADAAFALLLATRHGPGRRGALAVWLLAVPALGATTYARFDLVPALLAGVALLLLATRPRVAAAAAALATGFKLWPALLLPALAAPRSSRRGVLLSTAAVGVVLVAASVLAGGWTRLVSPLTWQADRGLQIESVAATPAIVGWALAPASFDITFSEYNAFEITGDGTAGMARLSGVLGVLAAAGLVALWWWAWRRAVVAPATVCWLALCAVSVFVVTGKVLSPQYLLWLLPMAAAAVLVTDDRSLRRWAALLLVATATTQLVFPELYGHLTAPGERTGVAVSALVLRNLMLLWLAAWATVRAVRAVSAAASSSATRPARTGGAHAASGGARPTRKAARAPLPVRLMRRGSAAPR
jgi:hypothetical protein